MLVSESRAAGVIRPYAGRILGNVFRLSTTRVRDVMVPRERILAIDRSVGSEEVLDLLRESGYTRLPVYDVPVRKSASSPEAPKAGRTLSQ